MEQLGDLKEQNTKLQRRVQYLEDLKRLQVMHKQLRGEEADAGHGQASARAAAGGGGASSAGAADPTARGRSRSVGVHIPQPPQQQRQSPQKSKAKVSKWTKVKEAFRWERAAFADHGHHHQQSQQQHKSSAARLAAAAAATATRASPSSSSSSSDDLDIHMHFSEIFPDTGGPGSSGGGSVSAAESRRLSFPEEEHDEEARRSRSLDADAITSQLSGKDMSPLSKSPSGKAHRTPWGKVKDIIIQTRKDSLKRRGAGSTDAHLDSACDGAMDGNALQSQDADSSKAGQAPRLTLTLASSEELRWPEHQSPPPRPPPKPSPSPVTDPEDDRRHNQQGSPPPCRRHSSKWTKVKKAFLTARQEDAGSPPYSPRDHAAFEYAAQTGDGEEVTSESLHAEIQRSYEELQHKLSLEFHEKLAEWERARLAVAASASGAPEAPTGGGGGGVLGLEEQNQLVALALQQRAGDKCFRRKMDEWERLRQQQQQHPLSADFRKKLHEWQRRKDAGPGGGSPRSARKANKELLWLEKELHKIAREKQRLERERDKFLQREARLEKMRSAMRAGQEVLVQTSTGSFRFQGISEAFTRRLFEWEQARGIGPEDSTFALLDPRYRPRPRQPAAIDENGGTGRDGEGAPLSRCKSAGSVAATGNLSLTRQASSLSLNDAQLEASAAAAAAAPPLEDGRAVSEPRLRTDALEDGEGEDAEDGPSAVIVDVEDEVVETASPLAAAPAVLGHTPIYCYAPREVTRLIDSSGSESDRDRKAIGGVCRNESVRTERSYRLLDENMDLLDKLKNNEDVCRKLEAEIEELEAKMEEAARNREQQLQNLEKASEARQVAMLRARVRELERRHERLKRQGATLQDSFAARSEQQAALACHLVGNIKQLQVQDPGLEDPLAFVRNLSTQVLQLSEQLAAAVRERSGSSTTATRRHRLASGLTWLSADGISLSADSLQDECPEGRQDLRELPALLTSKVLELKRGLSFLCGTDRSGADAVEEARAAVLSRRNARQSQVQGAASSGSDSDDDDDDDDDDEGDGSVQPAQPAVGGAPAAFYETEVPPASKAGCYRHKKLLRARRVSDTHVGYRTTESPSAGHQRDTDDSDNSAKEEDRRSAPRRSPPRSRSRLADSEGGSPRAGRVYALAENGAGRYSTCEEDTEESRQSEKDGGLPELRHRIAPPEQQDAFMEEQEEEEEQGDEEEAPTNVFVKTTRKIFSPVRRDSKGKASSVIGFVVGASVNGARGNRGSRRESLDSGGREKKEESVGAPNGGSMPESPARVARHTRSQSASPAVVRRPSTASKEGSSSADTSSSGTTSCDSKAVVSGTAPTPPERPSEDLEPEENRDDPQEEVTETVVKLGRTKATELAVADHIPPPTGLPPVSHSPMSSRRGGSDQPRPLAKETAPSIRMMIAKYNKNLEGASVETSCTGGSTGSAAPNGTTATGGSPVAWRSPATERRVRLQMEKYQEEVRRALESGGVPNTGTGRHVQKSASVGFIPASPVSRSAGGSPRKPPSGAAAAVQTKGILKSSSASAIQADLSQSTRVSPQEKANESSVLPPPALFEDSSPRPEGGAAVQPVTPQPARAASHSASASPLSLLRPSVSPATSNPSSPELAQRKSADGGGSVGSSPPPSRLRALRLKRAKEEFLTRGPASRSWTGSASGEEASPPPPALAAAGCRLSLAASADSSPLRAASAARAAHDEAQLLVKSASAGAISPTSQQPPHSADRAASASAGAASGSKASRFGLASSIASRFRKVKMRRTGRGHGQQQQGQGAVSALCRQSLLVDLGGDAAERAAAAAAPATKSCPSSPVLRRPPQPPPPRPPSSPTNDDESKSSCWVKKKIFRPKS
ncbi:uncharacterized protein LOC126153633 [Schistocerca cancellata]|uniref:uncharacterized protein LOC126153633 n=1 Tax=Schistocerca cancellata TaxID=274614 RepID=UPI0021185FBE|nr:uncharacterized protein LOC126153633 [Schistocerca cancellata]